MNGVEIREIHDSAIHRTVTAILRVLTIVAGLVILVGGVLLLVRHGDAVTSFRTFAGEPASLRLVSEIVAGAFQGHALAVVQFGILLLTATPSFACCSLGLAILSITGRKCRYLQGSG
jgi:uncharacterized membrane protein